MVGASARPEHAAGSIFQDGLGERFRAAEAGSGELVEVLRLRRMLTDSPAFETALRERVARLTTLQHASCARVYRVDRLDIPTPGLTVVSQYGEGVRLSDLLRVAHERSVGIDISTTMVVLRQLLPAVTLLHEHARDVACGLIAPERLVVTPRGRLVVAEQVLSGAIEQLHYGADRLWRELRIAAGPEPTPFSHRTDVMCIGLVALALMLGRPLRDDEFPDQIPLVVDAVRERSSLGHERGLSAPLRDWLVRALQLIPGGSFASAPEAWLAFERVIAADPLYIPIPIALDLFLYRCTAARIPPSASEAVPQGALPPHAFRPVSSAAPGAASGQPDTPTSRLGPAAPDVPKASPAQSARAPAPAAAASATTDWTGPPAASPHTSFDIARLFADADPSPSSTGDEEPRAAEPTPPAPIAPGAACEESYLDPGPMPAAVPLAMHDTPPAHEWTDSRPANLRSLLRRWGVAAVIVSLMASGVLVTRWLRPEVVAASGMGTLVVETTPAGLQVLVDGVEQGLTPSRLMMPAGDHTLEVRGPEAARVVPFTIAADTEVTKHLEFPAVPETQQPADLDVPRGTTATTAPSTDSPPPATPARGWLTVKAPFPIEIHLGGQLVATTSGQRVRIVEGRHRVEFRNRTGSYRAVRVVHIMAGTVTEVVLEGDGGEG
jgi:hypothetical protein